MRVPAWMSAYVLDPLERAASTFGEQFLVLILPTLSVGAAVHRQDWAAAADSAAFAAILSLITSFLTFKVPTLRPSTDLLWRVIKTGLQAFFGVIAADQFTHSVVHADWHSALATAIAAAGAALLKGWAVMGTGYTVPGASALPWRLGIKPLEPPSGVASSDRPQAPHQPTPGDAPLDPNVDLNHGYDPVTREVSATPASPGQSPTSNSQL